MDDKNKDFSKILAELKEIRRLLGAGQKLFLTVDEAAASLGLSPKTVRNQLWLGTFPVKAHKYGGKRLFRTADLAAWAASLGEGDAQP